MMLNRRATNGVGAQQRSGARPLTGRVARFVAMSTLVVAAVGLSAGAASATPVAVADRTAAPAVSAAGFWVYYGTYPSWDACFEAGEANFAKFECVATKDEGGTAYILYYYVEACHPQRAVTALSCGAATDPRAAVATRAALS